MLLRVVAQHGDVEQRLRSPRRARRRSSLACRRPAAASRHVRFDAAGERCSIADSRKYAARSLASGTSSSCIGEREQRDGEPDDRERHEHAHERDAAGFHRRDLALAREPAHREQRAEQHRHRDDEQQIRRHLPQEVFDRDPERRVLLRDEPADREKLRRDEDQRERGRAEKRRAAAVR